MGRDHRHSELELRIVMRFREGRPILFSNLAALVNFAKLRAQRGIWTGRQTVRDEALIAHCSHQYLIRPDLAVGLIYTRDVGHHSSGMWKNPDYERCYHLSLGFLGMPGAVPVPFEKAEAEEIVRAFWDDDARKAWVEPPYSDVGKERDVWHYRLFADAAWQSIQPRKEVYSKDFTPAGWKSFSEVHAS